jgi:hypothetical protein
MPAREDSAEGWTMEEHDFDEVMDPHPVLIWAGLGVLAASAGLTIYWTVRLLLS